MDEYKLLYYGIGCLTSASLYFIAGIKGKNDMIKGKDTFFCRAAIPLLNIINKISKENPITTEAEFQELLRFQRESNNTLENSVKKGDEK